MCYESKPDLAVFSPLPPSKSGIADYCCEQLPFLSKDWRINVVIDDKAPEPITIPCDVAVVRLSAWKKNFGRDATVRRLYHLGNNPYHEFVFEEIHNHPGVVVLHDYVLHHLVAHMTLGRNDFESYERIMEHDHGIDGRKMAHHRAHYVFTEYQQFHLPLNGTVLENAAGVIVHSHASVSKIREKYPLLPVVRIPHHYSPPPKESELDSKTARIELGLREDRIILISLGFVTPPKQIDLALEALGKIKNDVPEFEYWLVGEVNDRRALTDKIRECGLEGRVNSTGFVDTATFYKFISAADILINLRYPSAGETSGTLVRALGTGICAIIFDYESFSDYPDTIAIKLPLNTQSTLELEKALTRAICDKDYRNGIAKKAAEYIRTQHEMEKCSEAYTKFIRETGDASPTTARQREFSTLYCSPFGNDIDNLSNIVDQYIAWIDDEKHGAQTREYAQTHSRRWAKTMEYVPRPEPNMSALELGSYQVVLPMLRHHFGYSRVVGTDYDPTGRTISIERELWAHGEKEGYEFHLFNLEKDPFPFDDESFDFVMCCEVVEHLSIDPMFMISEINRILLVGGVLLLTTPNIASARGLGAMLQGYSPYLYPDFNRNRSSNRHNIEYSPHQVAAMIRAGGFEIIKVETPDCWEDSPKDILEFLVRNGYPTHLRGDNIVCLAYKKTDMIERYPADIYGPGDVVLRSSKLGPIPE